MHRLKGADGRVTQQDSNRQALVKGASIVVCKPDLEEVGPCAMLSGPIVVPGVLQVS